MQIRWNNIILAVLALFFVALLWKQCEGEPRERVVIRQYLDTVTIVVPRVVLRDVPGRTRLIHDTVTDDRALSALIGNIDSLQQQIARMGVRRVFVVDTITLNGDTLFVECDETRKTITVDLRPAPVDTVITRTDTLTITDGSQTLFTPYVQASAVVDAMQQWGAQGSLGVRLHFGGRAHPFADASYNTISGALVRLGMEITF